MKLNLLHAIIFTPMGKGRWGLPVIFEDMPGVGKSSVIEAFGERCQMPTEVLSPSERGEGAFGVIPVPKKDGTIGYPPPDYTARFAAAGGRGIVFLDELTSAPPILQAPCMGIACARRIGSHQLSGGVRVIAACNPPEVAANGYDLAPPLANRFGWLKWGAPTIEERQAYMLGRATEEAETLIDPEQEEARVMRGWGEAYARAVGLDLSFLSAQPEWKNKVPKQGAPALSRAWPSDRSWEYATRALASSEVHNLTPEERDELVSAFIGAEAYAAFCTFVEEQDLPPIADVLDGKVEFTHSKSRLDRTAAVLNSAAALVTPKDAKKRAERSAKLWQLLDTVGKGHLDLVVPVAHALVHANLHTAKEAVNILAKIQPVLAAANVRGGVK